MANLLEVKHNLFSLRTGREEQEQSGSCCSRKKRDLLAPLRNFDEELSLLEAKKEPLRESIYRGLSFAKVKAEFEKVKFRFHSLLRSDGQRWGCRLLSIRRDNLLSQFSYAHLQGNQVREDKVRKELEEINSQIISNLKKSECNQLLLKVARKVEALAYRELTKNDRKKQHFELQTDKKWLQEALTFWKVTHFPAIPEQFSEIALKRIDECCSYRGLISRLQDDPQYCRDFFESVFRNLLTFPDAVSMACEFPSITERFHSTFIEKRIVRLQLNDALEFREKEEGDEVQKDVLLKIDGKFQSLRDESQEITFRSQKRSSLKEIFDSFALKNTIVGEFEFGPLGIVHFPPKLPPANFKEKEWWKTLAPFQTMNQEAVEARYGVHLAQGQGVISIRASRQNPDGYHFVGSHSWFETVIPNGDGTFQILPIGKYPDVEPYPTGALETFFYTYTTKRAYLNYPDENSFYNHREQIGVAHIAQPQHLERWFNKVKEDLLACQRGELIFQAQGDSCAVWVQEVLDYAFDKTYQGQPMPRYFDVDFYKAVAPRPFHLMTNFYSFLANKVSRTAANVLRFVQGSICGAWKGYKHYDSRDHKIVTSRLASNPRWYTGRIMLPCELFHTAQERAM
jgi:hypothetical protein